MQLSFIGLLRGNKLSLKASSVLENNIVKRFVYEYLSFIFSKPKNNR